MRSAIAALAVCLTTWSACAEAMRIGVVAPLSGPSEILGKQIVSGAVAAAGDAALDIADDACTALGGSEAAKRFVAAKVAFVVGFLCAESIEAALPILKEAGIRVITPGVRRNSLTDRRSRTRFPVYRLGPRDDSEADAVATKLTQLWEAKLFAIVDDGTIYGRDLSETFRAAAEQAALKPIFIDTFRPQMDNQIGLIGRLRKAGATHVFVGGDRDDVAIMGRDAAGLGASIIFAGGEALRSAPGEVPLVAGTLMIGLPEWADIADPAIVAALGARGVVAEGYVLPAYAAMQVALQAAATPPAPGSAQPQPLAGDFRSVVGTLRFDDKGDLSEKPLPSFQLRRREIRAGGNAMMPRAGATNSITDVAGLAVGNAEDLRLKSGVTVVLCEEPAIAGYQILGGAPGTRETDLLEPHNSVHSVNAIVLSGGSSFGLDAGAGVQAWLRQQGIGLAVGGHRVPIVPGAILFDLANGGDKAWGRYGPYRELGYEAARTAQATFATGTAGAGTGALTAGLKGGLGSASTVLDNGVTIGALAAVNAIGSATLHRSRHFWAAPFEIGSEFGGLGYPQPLPAGSSDVLLKYRDKHVGQNTTIAVIATDAILSKADAKRLAMAAHDGFVRAIWPTHTPADGDIVFALATGRSGVALAADDAIDLYAMAGATMARAIARGVHAATPADGICFRSGHRGNDRLVKSTAQPGAMRAPTGQRPASTSRPRRLPAASPFARIGATIGNAFPPWRAALFGAVLWAMAMAISASWNLVDDGWQSDDRIRGVAFVFALGGFVAFPVALTAAALVSAHRHAEGRFAAAFLALMLATITATTAVYALEYRIYYAQWHADMFSVTWLIQFVFTGAWRGIPIRSQRDQALFPDRVPGPRRSRALVCAPATLRIATASVRKRGLP